MSDSTLTADQLKAIDAILTSDTLGDAAKVVGVDPRTISRWLQQPGFSRELRAAQRDIIRHNIRGMAGMARTAIKTLTDLMVRGEDEEVRFKAAQEALERLLDADLVFRADEDSEAETVRGEDEG